MLLFPYSIYTYGYIFSCCVFWDSRNNLSSFETYYLFGQRSSTYPKIENLCSVSQFYYLIRREDWPSYMPTIYLNATRTTWRHFLEWPIIFICFTTTGGLNRWLFYNQWYADWSVKFPRLLGMRLRRRQRQQHVYSHTYTRSRNNKKRDTGSERKMKLILYVNWINNFIKCVFFRVINRRPSEWSVLKMVPTESLSILYMMKTDGKRAQFSPEPYVRYPTNTY